jgi:iron complex outermembrane receptor protein
MAHSKTRSLFLTTTLGFTLLAPLAASAQTAIDAEESIEASGGIVVTARRRAESAQRVPVQINAVSGDQIERAQVQNLDDLTRLVPGLQLQTGGGKLFNQLSIRGVSALSVLSDDPNVATFVDGVYVSGRNAQDFELLDLARVEVVKGPQNALYGRQAFAGAVNFVTAVPDNDFKGHATADIGSAARRRYVAGLSGPMVADKVFARIAATSDESGGTYRDFRSGKRLGGYKTEAISGTLRIKPSTAFDLVLTSAYNKDRIGHTLQVVLPGNCQPNAAGFLQAICGEHTAAAAGPLTFDPRAFGLKRSLSHTSLTATWDFAPDLQIVSLTGYNTVHSDPLNDGDRQLAGAPVTVRRNGVPAGTVLLPTFNTGGETRTREFMQDLRVQSSSQQPLQFTLGASYYRLREGTANAGAIDISSLPPGVTPTSTIFRQIALPAVLDGSLPDSLITVIRTRYTRALAGFGALEYTLGNLRARAELRYTAERKRLVDILPAPNDRRADFNSWTPRFSLDYSPYRDTMLYASIAKGTISGGFNSAAVPAQFQAYGSSTNWTYEIGAKTTALDGRLTANLNIFYIDIGGLQLLSPTILADNSTLFVTQTVGTASSKGFEIELSARPLTGLTFDADYVYADAKFDDAIDSSLSRLPFFAARGNDISDQPLPSQAKHTFTVAGEYRGELGEKTSWYARSDVSYSSKRYLYPEKSLGYTGERTIVNARLGVTFNQVEASIWARNLFNNKTPLVPNNISIVGTGNNSAPAVTLAPLRTYGVSFGYRF